MENDGSLIEDDQRIRTQVRTAQGTTVILEFHLQPDVVVQCWVGGHMCAVIDWVRAREWTTADLSRIPIEDALLVTDLDALKIMLPGVPLCKLDPVTTAQLRERIRW